MDNAMRSTRKPRDLKARIVQASAQTNAPESLWAAEPFWELSLAPLRAEGKVLRSEPQPELRQAPAARPLREGGKYGSLRRASSTSALIKPWRSMYRTTGPC